MFIEELRTMKLVDLTCMLTYSEITPEFRNSIIYEIATRIYVPGRGVMFEDLLEQLGYQFPTNDLGVIRK